MPLFAVHALDGPGAAEKRSIHIAAHLAHVEANIARYAVAGPLRDGEGEVTGSLLVIDADDLADARAFLGEDPYAQAELWAEVRVHAFSAAAGDWVGGVTWK
jgi:uncharacterized protein YciI